MAFENENEILLEKLQNPEETENTETIETKPGTKQYLIEKIRELEHKHNLIVEESNTVLKRKSKKDLQKTLAEYVEKAMQQEIQKKLNMKVPECADSSEDTHKQLMAVSVLRMMHDSIAKLAEHTTSAYTPFEITGFCESMKDPNVSQQIDECLLEIAKENDVIQHIQSPYARLLICWSGGILSNLKRKTNNGKYSRNVESRKSQESKSNCRDTSRVQTVRKELSNDVLNRNVVRPV